MNPVVGIGELLWDVYPDGRKVAGGAPFNFAFHCHQLGLPAVIVSRVGDDELGRALRDQVRRFGMSDEFIKTDHAHPTGTVQVTLDEQKIPTYTITENVAWDHVAWSEQLAGLAAACRAVCFGSLAQRSDQTRGTLQTFVQAVRRSGGLGVFDVNIRKPYECPDTLEWSLNHCDWIKKNEVDQATLDYYFGDQPWPDGQPIPVWITTLGGAGCEVLPPDGPAIREPAVPVRLVDTVGAGDAFTAAMLYQHLEGRPLHACVWFANHYAARVCEHQGATPRIDRAEIEQAAFGKSG